MKKEDKEGFKHTHDKYLFRPIISLEIFIRTGAQRHAIPAGYKYAPSAAAPANETACQNTQDALGNCIPTAASI